MASTHTNKTQLRNRTLKVLLLLTLSLLTLECVAWGFYAHKRINFIATFILPSEMFGFYKANQDILVEAYGLSAGVLGQLLVFELEVELD